MPKATVQKRARKSSNFKVFWNRWLVVVKMASRISGGMRKSSEQGKRDICFYIIAYCSCILNIPCNFAYCAPRMRQDCKEHRRGLLAGQRCGVFSEGRLQRFCFFSLGGEKKEMAYKAAQWSCRVLCLKLIKEKKYMVLHVTHSSPGEVFNLGSYLTCQGRISSCMPCSHSISLSIGIKG